MEQNFFTVATDDKIINTNEKWFKFFNLLPKISTIIFAIAFFVLGIVLSAEDEAWWLLVFWLGGAGYCIINYLVLKLALSYPILHIYYLKKLTSGSTSAPTQATEDELPQI